MDFVGNRETLNSDDVQAVVRSVWSEDINQIRSSKGQIEPQKIATRNGTPQSTEEPDHTLDGEAAEVRRGPQGWREGFEDEYQKTERAGGKRMPAFGAPEYELVAGWLDGRTTQRGKTARVEGQRLGLEEKTQATAGKCKATALLYDRG